MASLVVILHSLIYFIWCLFIREYKENEGMKKVGCFGFLNYWKKHFSVSDLCKDLPSKKNKKAQTILSSARIQPWFLSISSIPLPN